MVGEILNSDYAAVVWLAVLFSVCCRQFKTVAIAFAVFVTVFTLVNYSEARTVSAERIGAFAAVVGCLMGFFFFGSSIGRQLKTMQHRPK